MTLLEKAMQPGPVRASKTPPPSSDEVDLVVAYFNRIINAKQVGVAMGWRSTNARIYRLLGYCRNHALVKMVKL